MTLAPLVIALLPLLPATLASIRPTWPACPPAPSAWRDVRAVVHDGRRAIVASLDCIGDPPAPAAVIWHADPFAQLTVPLRDLRPLDDGR